MSKIARVSFLLDRWEQGVLGLSHNEEYVYFRVCKFIWAEGRPLREAEAGPVCRFLPDWQAIIASLVAAGKLTQTADGIANGRAAEEHRRAVAISDAGKKAINKRWNKEDAYDRTYDRNTSPSPSPSPSTTPKEKKDSRGSNDPLASNSQHDLAQGGPQDGASGRKTENAISGPLNGHLGQEPSGTPENETCLSGGQKIAGKRHPRQAHTLAEAVDAWNAMVGRAGLAQVQRLTDARKRALGARLAECGGLDGWYAALAKIEASPFLRGLSGNRKWRATFDFCVKEQSFTKIMEGAYDDRSAQHRADQDRDLDRIILESTGLAGGLGPDAAGPGGYDGGSNGHGLGARGPGAGDGQGNSGCSQAHSGVPGRIWPDADREPRGRH